ncbi:MAG TPA: c-type cytochrome domain-containing protein [Flavisolibacter sp.]
MSLKPASEKTPGSSERPSSWNAPKRLPGILSLKIYMALAVTVSMIAFASSCKHYIPIENASPGSGPNNPPATSTCSVDTIYFQQQVLPVFISNCAMSGCHDAASHKEGINLTSYSGIMSGGIRAGNPGSSKLYNVIIDGSMPPRPYSTLTQDQINSLNKWITQGAKNNSCVDATCDTANVTFTASVKGIIANKCQGCHSSSSPGGGSDLTTYNGVKAVVNNGKLWGSINFLSGYSAMPKGGTKLSTCELAKIRKWIAAGAPNN